MIFKLAEAYARGHGRRPARSASELHPLRAIQKPHKAGPWREALAGAIGSAVFLEAFWDAPVGAAAPILMGALAYAAAREALRSSPPGASLAPVPGMEAGEVEERLWRFKGLVERLEAARARLPDNAATAAMGAFLAENLLLGGDLLDRPADLPKAIRYLDGVLANATEATETFARLSLKDPCGGGAPDFTAFMKESRQAALDCRHALVRSDEDRLAVDIEAQRRITGLRHRPSTQDNAP